MSRYLLAVSLILNILLGFYLFRSQNAPVASTQSPLYTVTAVYDGDTIALDNHQQIRLLNLNAAELNNCSGPEAKSFLEGLVLGKKVKVVGDQNDINNRLLALVYLNDELINEKLISAGLARFKSQASPESSRLQKAFTEAKAAKRGLFSYCIQSQNPQNPKCSIKGNNREGDKTYSFPGCGSYQNTILELDQGDRWFCTEKDAQSAGFTKALNCHNKSFN